MRNLAMLLLVGILVVSVYFRKPANKHLPFRLSAPFLCPEGKDPAVIEHNRSGSYVSCLGREADFFVYKNGGGFIFAYNTTSAHAAQAVYLKEKILSGDFQTVCTGALTERGRIVFDGFGVPKVQVCGGPLSERLEESLVTWLGKDTVDWRKHKNIFQSLRRGEIECSVLESESYTTTSTAGPWPRYKLIDCNGDGEVDKVDFWERPEEGGWEPFARVVESKQKAFEYNNHNAEWFFVHHEHDAPIMCPDGSSQQYVLKQESQRLLVFRCNMPILVTPTADYFAPRTYGEGLKFQLTFSLLQKQAGKSKKRN